MKDWPRRRIQKIFRMLGFEIHRVRHPAAHGFDHTRLRLTALRDLGFHPGTICDVGASDGSWSRQLRDIFPGARYFCVDPLIENRASLDQLCAEFSNVSYWQGCLGSKTGKAILNVDGAGTSVFRGHTGNPYGIQREVGLETLDALIRSGVCPEPDLLKLDVQGYELEVLKGATNALRKIQAVIAEVSFFPFQTGMPLFHVVTGHLAEHGFLAYDVLGLCLRPLDGALAQADLLFLQEAHPLRRSNKWDRNSVY